MAQEPVNIPPSTPAPPPEPPAVDEAVIRKYAREKYGIEDDDPEVYKQKVGKWREDAELIPRYHGALTQAQRHLELLRQPQSTQVQPVQEDESQLRELWRIDPMEGWKRA